MSVSGAAIIRRICDSYKQVQQCMVVQTAEAVQEVLQPRGVGVVVEGKHLCMMARGIEKKSSDMVISHVMGTLRSDRATRVEFMNLLHNRR